MSVLFTTMFVTVLVVLVGDQAIKLLVRRLVGGDAIALGAYGSVRVVTGQLWLRWLGGPIGDVTMWSIWAAASISLVIAGAWAPLDPVFVGLLVGGSLSHAVESSMRGFVTDYICVRNWAFSLADMALAVGAIGVVVEFLLFFRQALT